MSSSCRRMERCFDAFLDERRVMKRYSLLKTHWRQPFSSYSADVFITLLLEVVAAAGKPQKVRVGMFEVDNGKLCQGPPTNLPRPAEAAEERGSCMLVVFARKDVCNDKLL